MSSSLLKKIRVEGIGLFAYTVNNSIDHNITTALLTMETCNSVKEALKVRKYFTLCRVDEDGCLLDLRKFESLPTRFRGLLSTDPEKPWLLKKLSEIYSTD